MPLSLSDIKGKKLQYLRELYGIMLAQDADVDDILNQLLSDTNRAFSRYSDGTAIRNRNALGKSVLNGLGSFIIAFGGVIANRNAEIVSANIRQSLNDIGKQNAIAYRQFEKRTANIPQEFKKSLLIRKRYGDGKTIQNRIKTIQKGAEKTVINIIGVGMDKGKTAKEIALDIQRYIKPSSMGRGLSPLEYYRQHWSVATTPRDLRAGSIEGNALRIARTEIATTNREVVYQMFKDDPEVRGFKWLLSPSHPLPDICDVYAEHNEGLGKGVWTTPPSTPHPNCHCGIEEYPPKQK
jgi:hypothetical protein